LANAREENIKVERVEIVISITVIVVYSFERPERSDVKYIVTNVTNVFIVIIVILGEQSSSRINY
jgi:hypothetical protein